MVRPEVLKKRLDKVDECLVLLEKMRSIPRDEFVTTPEHYLSAERLLQLSIEATIDMGNHVIADLNLGHADWGSQIPDILAEKRVNFPSTG